MAAITSFGVVDIIANLTLVQALPLLSPFLRFLGVAGVILLY
jgi:hypothetical protein